VHEDNIYAEFGSLCCNGSELVTVASTANIKGLTIVVAYAWSCYPYAFATRVSHMVPYQEMCPDFTAAHREILYMLKIFFQKHEACLDNQFLCCTPYNSTFLVKVFQ
jgi:hypothetical protein